MRTKKNTNKFIQNIESRDIYGSKKKKKLWKYQDGVKKDPLQTLRDKIICPISKDETKYGSKDNHPDHISKEGKCRYCGVLK